MADTLAEEIAQALNISLEEFWRTVDYARAEAWLAQYRDVLTGEHPGGYLLINVDDLSYAVGKDFNDAYQQYVEMYNLTPQLGRHFLGQRL